MKVFMLGDLMMRLRNNDELRSRNKHSIFSFMDKMNSKETNLFGIVFDIFTSYYSRANAFCPMIILSKYIFLCPLHRVGINF